MMIQYKYKYRYSSKILYRHRKIGKNKIEKYQRRTLAPEDKLGKYDRR